MEEQHLTKAETTWIQSLIKSAVGKVVVTIIFAALCSFGGYAWAIYKFKDEMKEMSTTIVSVVAANEELKRSQDVILKNSSSTAVIDSIRSFRYDMRFIGMNVEELQIDLLVFKAQYSTDMRTIQSDIKEILRSQRLGSIDTVFDNEFAIKNKQP